MTEIQTRPLTTLDKMRLSTALFNQAENYRQASEYWKKKGYAGIAASCWGDALAFMELRERVCKI